MKYLIVKGKRGGYVLKSESGKKWELVCKTYPAGAIRDITEC